MNTDFVSNTDNSYELGNKQALIALRPNDDWYHIKFYQNGDLVGTIDYRYQNIHYVRDAAQNWIDGVLTLDTIKNYQ